MPDAPTALTALALAIGGRDTLAKVLGPTADYLGGVLKDWTQHRLENLAAIFKAAAAKLPPNAANEAVPPRVLAGILSDGSFSTDPLMAEYFGGVLASSRSGVTRDDRGAFFTSILSRLSVYQVRAHYVLYSALRGVHIGSDISFMSDEGRLRLSTFISGSSLAEAMAFEPEEDADALLSHIIFGLDREKLINARFEWGAPDRLRGFYPGAVEMGLLYGPSSLGVELFLWAHGLGRERPLRFLSNDLTITPLADVPSQWHCTAVYPPEEPTNAPQKKQ